MNGMEGGGGGNTEIKIYLYKEVGGGRMKMWIKRGKKWKEGRRKG